MFRKILISILMFIPVCGMAQFNTDRVMTIGRSALYYEDYVLSIQYFNQVIYSKPFLYEPWFFRGVAKYNLDDFKGAEDDCTQAIKINPFVTNVYQLRGLCRIQQGRFADAVKDYIIAIKYDPENQGLWYNRVLCSIQQKDLDNAKLDIDTLISHWSNYAKGYELQADAVKSLDKCLEIDPYDGEAWSARAVISLSREKWKESENYLNRAIHLLPKVSGNYINRALTRYKQNNLRGAMADYDLALDNDPNNFLGHYNRGLLRAQVGDDNRAITDFDFVLRLDPDNLMALFNRALLLDHTGNLRRPIRDYSRVIKQYPNFWTGLHYRAVCYRKLGHIQNAEQDEFRILKAQLDKRYGVSHNARHSTRKKSETDMDKYNSLVVADDSEVDHEYKSEYRGRIQNRKVDIEYQQMYELSYSEYQSDVKSYIAYTNSVDDINHRADLSHKLFINCSGQTLDEVQSHKYFALLDSFTRQIDSVSNTTQKRNMLLLQRAVAFSVIQNFESAVEDLSSLIKSDSTMSLAFWQRAVCQFKQYEFETSQGLETKLKEAKMISDFTQAIDLDHNNPYLYYDRANVYSRQKDYSKAIADYTEAIRNDKNLAEAYYNRGLSYIYSGKKDAGIQDLSKAGELGLYTAYSVIKKYRK